MAAPRVNEVSEAVTARAKVLAPVRTGALRASIRKTMRARRNSVTGTVKANVNYAYWVHQGTHAHFIAARRRKFLRFQGPGGGWVFRKMVRHPGTKPQPYLTTALHEVAPIYGFKVQTTVLAINGDVG